MGISGEGVMVELNKSKLGKVKYYHGHVVGRWYSIGEVEKTSKWRSYGSPKNYYSHYIVPLRTFFGTQSVA
ncbi:hypothetical protein HZS_6067 [Henneguya salminicola]|nr:hypothetical protein HZS_6067 [Henneguya salminicola]